MVAKAGQDLQKVRSSERMLFMVQKQVKVINEMGFHMRPANEFISKIMRYKSDVAFAFNGRRINAKSIMHIMAACIKCGSEITVICDGEDEEAALEEAVSFIQSGMGEK